MEVPTLQQLKQRKAESDNQLNLFPEVRNLLEEIAWRYIEKFNWTNETFFNDYKFFWSAARTYWSHHTPVEFEKVMSWAADHQVHPRGIASLLKKA